MSKRRRAKSAGISTIYFETGDIVVHPLLGTHAPRTHDTRSVEFVDELLLEVAIGVGLLVDQTKALETLLETHRLRDLHTDGHVVGTDFAAAPLDHPECLTETHFISEISVWAKSISSTSRSGFIHFSGMLL